MTLPHYVPKFQPSRNQEKAWRHHTHFPLRKLDESQHSILLSQEIPHRSWPRCRKEYLSCIQNLPYHTKDVYIIGRTGTSSACSSAHHPPVTFHIRSLSAYPTNEKNIPTRTLTTVQTGRFIIIVILVFSLSFISSNIFSYLTFFHLVFVNEENTHAIPTQATVLPCSRSPISPLG